jgi:DnaK suppressor protein
MTLDSGLTESQLGEIRVLLLKRKELVEEEIRKGFSRFLEDTADEETTVVDVEEGDESHVDVGKEMSFQFMSRRSSELRQIKDALVRIDSGEYGICDECENPIRFERLKILPFAQLCRSCQQDSERKERERGSGARGPFRL